ncbi:hypothetical protein Smp_157190 [Schistosoma mansoni]|uniref:hypothetical protein n=1 Tax=Schistosoma mansoni TaxID=6183 RepID=UPI0001A630E7|nr:hypothetical protein Smp_157190 [Schistosoma mansoni]|eukprot:XP_018655033.1 hypothetical protein Smp_157190 [Schistosoma mansoni]
MGHELLDVDVNHSVKELSQGSMLSFPEFVCTFECMYKLSHGIFRARYETCEDKVLSPPPSFVSGELDLYRAYECDSPVWLANSVVNCEQVKAEFPNIFKSGKIFQLLFQELVKLNKVDRPDGRACGVNFNHLLSERKLDSSEAIWNAVKDYRVWIPGGNTIYGLLDLAHEN